MHTTLDMGVLMHMTLDMGVPMHPRRRAGPLRKKDVKAALTMRKKFELRERWETEQEGKLLFSVGLFRFRVRHPLVCFE